MNRRHCRVDRSNRGATVFPFTVAVVVLWSPELSQNVIVLGKRRCRAMSAMALGVPKDDIPRSLYFGSFQMAERAHSSSRSARMNERQLWGSERAHANGRNWVEAAARLRSARERSPPQSTLALFDMIIGANRL